MTYKIRTEYKITQRRQHILRPAAVITVSTKHIRRESRLKAKCKLHSNKKSSSNSSLLLGESPTNYPIQQCTCYEHHHRCHCHHAHPSLFYMFDIVRATNTLLVRLERTQRGELCALVLVPQQNAGERKSSFIPVGRSYDGNRSASVLELFR